MTFGPVAPRLERLCRAASRYAWLNDLVAVASAGRRPDAVILDFYAVS